MSAASVDDESGEQHNELLKMAATASLEELAVAIAGLDSKSVSTDEQREGIIGDLQHRMAARS